MQKIQFVSYKQTKSWSKQSWGEDHDNKWKTEDRNQVFNQSRDEDNDDGDAVKDEARHEDRARWGGLVQRLKPNMQSKDKKETDNEDVKDDQVCNHNH